MSDTRELLIGLDLDKNMFLHVNYLYRVQFEIHSVA